MPKEKIIKQKPKKKLLSKYLRLPVSAAQLKKKLKKKKS